MSKLKIQYGKCNNACAMCEGNLLPVHPFEPEACLAALQNKQVDELEISGGEFFLYPGAFEFIATAKESGCQKIKVVTNGRVLAYRSFLERAIISGVTHIEVKIFGHRPDLHEYVSGVPGSFAQSLSGLKNALEADCYCSCVLPINRSNCRHLPEMLAFVGSLGVEKIRIAFPGFASAENNSSFGRSLGRTSLVAKALQSSAAIIAKYGLAVEVEPVGLCSIKASLPMGAVFLKKDSFASSNGLCSECEMKNDCIGPGKAYLENFGDLEFQPVVTSARKRFLNLFYKVSGRLIDTQGLNAQKEYLDKIFGILFDHNFDPRLLKENQKFDFSFSSSRSGNYLRFSYNDYGDKDLFFDKLWKIFSIFPTQYSRSKLLSAFRFMGGRNAPHQTTFGIEWKAGENYPRIKLYFEELFNVYSPEETRRLAAGLYRAVGIDADPLFQANDVVAALSIDFLPDRVMMAKSYVLIRGGLGALDNYLSTLPISISGKEWDGFRTISSTDSFYYVTKRIDSDGLLSSIKVYNIFESQVGAIKERARLAELESYLTALGGGGVVNDMLSLIDHSGGVNRPVIVAVDFRPDGTNKVDTYLTFSI
jgi:MoaA/NifB/PqqE/SkfB family radical SAM enzyme